MKVPVHKTMVHQRRDYSINLVNCSNFQSQHCALLNVCPTLGSQSDSVAAVLASYNHLSKLGCNWAPQLGHFRVSAPDGAITGPAEAVAAGLGAFIPCAYSAFSTECGVVWSWLRNYDSTIIFTKVC